MRDTEHRIQDTGYRRQEIGYRIQDTGYRMQETGYRSQDTGDRIHDTDSLSFAIRVLCWDNGCWPHVGPQDPPKIGQQSINKSLQKNICFLIDFMLIYVRF